MPAVVGDVNRERRTEKRTADGKKLGAVWKIFAEANSTRGWDTREKLFAAVFSVWRCMDGTK